MKYITILLLVIVFSSCVNKTYKNEFVIENVNKNEDGTFTYRIQAEGVQQFYLIRNYSEWQAGDTLTLVKKKKWIKG